MSNMEAAWWCPVFLIGQSCTFLFGLILAMLTFRSHCRCSHFANADLSVSLLSVSLRWPSDLVAALLSLAKLTFRSLCCCMFCIQCHTLFFPKNAHKTNYYLNQLYPIKQHHHHHHHILFFCNTSVTIIITIIIINITIITIIIITIL